MNRNLLDVAERIYNKMIEGKNINPYEYKAILGEAISEEKNILTIHLNVEVKKMGCGEIIGTKQSYNITVLTNEENSRKISHIVGETCDIYYD